MYSAPSNFPKQKVNLLPDAEYNNEWSQERSFKLLKRFNDPRFGDISVMRNQGNQVIFAKEKMASNKSEITEDISYAKKRFSMNHMNVMKMVGYSAVTNKELCSTTYNLKSFYEFPRTDADKELADRKKMGADFTHGELTHLAYQVVEGLSSVHQNGIPHGDIRPQLIGYDKQQNHFALLDRLSDPTSVERCQTNNIVNKKDIYMSPELYKKLKGKNKTLTYNAQKNDIFSLGLTLLFLGTGESVQSFYLPDGEVEKRQLQEFVMNFDTKYSEVNPLLCNIVKSLLETDESRRQELYYIIKQFPPYNKFCKDEAQGVPLNSYNAQNNNPNTNPKPSAPNPQPQPSQQKQVPVQPNPQPPQQQGGHGDNNNTQKSGKDTIYTFPTEDNEDFEGFNPYMVNANHKPQSNVKNSAPIQQSKNTQPYRNSVNDSQYTQSNQYIDQYNNSSYGNNHMPTTQTIYVQSPPQQLNSYAPKRQSYQSNVQSVPQYSEPTYFHPQQHTRYVQSMPYSQPAITTEDTYFDNQGNKITRKSFVGAPTEVRKSLGLNPNPSPNPTVEGIVIKKRFVVREDGSMVELDANAKVNVDEIQKYFDPSYNKNAIAKYDDASKVLKTKL